MEFLKKNGAGLLLCLCIAIPAWLLGQAVPVVGGPVFSILIGMVLTLFWKDKTKVQPGIGFTSKKVLQYAVILLGFGLNLSEIAKVGAQSLPIIVSTIGTSLIVSFVLCKAMKVPSNISTLVGVGSSICGGSAIAATAPVIGADDEEIAQAISVIFLFNVIAALTFPTLGGMLGMTDHGFGLFAGTAVNDTSSVVAAQETYAGLMGLEGYALPATIKVVRTAMIIVLALIFSVISIRNEARSAARSDGQHANIGKIMWKALPKFILAFVAMIAVNTILRGNIADTYFYQSLFKPLFTNGYKFFVTIALSGVGFKIKFKELFTKGLKPIALGGCTWLALFLSSLTFASLFAEKMLG